MKHLMPRINLLLALSLSAMLAAFSATPSPGVNGTWTNRGGGVWGNSNNWSSGIVANGPGATADFSALDLTVDTTVLLDSARTIGNLVLMTPTSQAPAH